MLVRTKLRCWLWGLLPLLAIAVLVVWAMGDRLEDDLTKRSKLALETAGIDWARPVFSGLDASINGEAPNEEERLKAIEVVQQVYGVRRVEDRLSLRKIVSPFTWSGRYGDGKLRLKGYVPSSKIKASVTGLAKAKFPQADVAEDLEVARGAPDAQKWFGQVSFSIGLLSRLLDGEVSLEGRKLSISGPARDAAAYKALRETLASALPLGLEKGSFDIRPPVVDTFFFTAKHETKALVLDGVVADAAAKEQLLKAVKAYFPEARLQEKLTLGSGQPNGWAEALMLSLGELAKLDAGELTLKNFDVQLEGLARDEDTANAIRRTVRSKYPTGFKVTDLITVKEPELPVASPYELTVFQAGDLLIVKGSIESEEQRKQILARLGALFPKLTIDDQMSLAGGAPGNFEAALMAVLGYLPGLENPRLEMSDNRIALSGMSPDVSVISRLASMPEGLPDGFEWTGRVKFDDSLQQAKEAEEAKKRAEEARLAAEKAEADRLAAEKAEAERLAEEKAEAERLAAEKEAAEKAEAEKAAAEKAEAERLAAEKAEADRLAAEKAEEERLAALKAKEEADKNAAKEEVTSAEELAEKRKWLSPEETEKRLDNIYKESAAVNARECQLLMNSIVRGSAIRFSVNSSVIRTESYDVLKKVSDVANRCTNTIIRIEGHTDSDGSQGYNLELSKRRAQAVINHLVKQGVPLERLDAKGNGERKPVASNATAKGKALNRRIEFVVFEN